MGYTTSTVHGIEVPDSAEANNVPEDIGKVVTALEGGSIVKRLTGAQIAALTSPQKPAGLVVYNTTTSKVQVSNGTSFADIDTAPAYAAWTPTLTASSSNPTASATSGENRYIQSAKKVDGVGHMQVTAAGSGTIRIPLPVAPRSSSALWMIVGTWSLVTGAGTAQETGLIIKVASQNYCHARRVPDYINTVLGQPSQDLTHSRLGDFVSAGTTYLTWQFTYEAA